MPQQVGWTVPQNSNSIMEALIRSRDGLSKTLQLDRSPTRSAARLSESYEQMLTGRWAISLFVNAPETRTATRLNSRACAFSGSAVLRLALLLRRDRQAGQYFAVRQIAMKEAPHSEQTCWVPGSSDILQTIWRDCSTRDDGAVHNEMIKFSACALRFSAVDQPGGDFRASFYLPGRNAETDREGLAGAAEIGSAARGQGF